MKVVDVDQTDMGWKGLSTGEKEHPKSSSLRPGHRK